MNNLKKRFEEGTNIMKFLREQNECSVGQNTVEGILRSYDLQAGSYTKAYYDPSEDNYIVSNKKVKLTMREAKEFTTQELAKMLEGLDFASFLEVGTGEATTLAPLISKINRKNVDYYATDISLSRLLYAELFSKKEIQQKNDIKFFVADMFNLPIADSSVDIVFTFHCIEPNTNRSREALSELYRVCSKYMILVEPSYELGNNKTRERIEEHAYIRDLYASAIELGYQVIEHKLLNTIFEENNSAVILIKKENEKNSQIELYACPSCKQKINKKEDLYFCNECGLLYPIVNNIPILLKDNAILCTQFNQF